MDVLFTATFAALFVALIVLGTAWFENWIPHKNLLSCLFAKRKRREMEANILWQTYKAHMERFEIWKQRNPKGKISDPDPQSILIQALAPLVTYTMMTGDIKAECQVCAHMKDLNDGTLVPSKNYDPPLDQLR
jgi:hypothetical protein